jgi:cell division protein FtsI (penicillin-binding protein 3)
MRIIRPGPNPNDDFSGRWRILLLLLVGSMTVLVGRAVYLQIFNTQFLIHQGDLRHVGVMPLPAHRGRIIDRNGELLAVSTPVKSLWVNPKEFSKTPVAPDRLRALAEAVSLPVSELVARIGAADGRSFVYLKRKLTPELADRAMDLGIPGLYADREYRRYYPTGEVTAHLLGITNINNQGQEGLELGLNSALKGIDGARRIVRDGKRRVIEATEELTRPVSGRDVTLSIDERLQYLAYRELKAAVGQHRARGGSLVLLDSRSGEILAMVNQPSFDPNARGKLTGAFPRNQAIIDTFEPGSTMKPFAVACGLELGLIRPETRIATGPGPFQIGDNIVKDVHNYGSLDVGGILQKSSNIGVSKIALRVPPKKFWAFYNNLGFGQSVETGFPSEEDGRLPSYRGWNAFEQATLSFGYGVSASALQLARAYSALANGGDMPMVTLLKRNGAGESHRIMSAETAQTVLSMLEGVVSREGTALKASIPGFRVAGKTGTAKKVKGRGYSSSAYRALFAGIAPASRPRLVMVVVIDEPSAGEYYGGTVAAPVFSSVMEGALRLLNIAPDEPAAPLLAGREDDPA